MPDSLSVSREMAAPPRVVWALIADLPRMGDWSPENEGGEWLDGATSAAPGVRFRGSNRNGDKSWKTLVTVVDADPAQRFSFTVKAVGIDIAEWSYDLEGSENGDACTVTETWIDRRPGWFKPLGRLATGVADRDQRVQAEMEATLAALATEAESRPTTD